MQGKAVDIERQNFENNTTGQRLFLMMAIIVIGFNLRPAITSVGPLLGTIRDEIGLANWSAGTITSLPLIAFAMMSPLAPKIANKLGNVRTILLGLFLLLGGIGIRSIPFTPTLFIGTATVGIGIAIMNVLLPAFIKEKFPHRVGRMTSVYSTSMNIFAATAAGLSVPLANGIGLGWELALLSWALITIVGIIIWLIVRKQDESIPHDELTIKTVPVGNLWKSALAWQVTFFMGLQSLLFYVIVSWLPEMMHDFGFSVATAGWLLSYVQFISLPGTFLAPVLAERYPNQQRIMLVIGGLCTVGFTGLLIGGPLPLIVLWLTFIGIVIGATISLSLALLGMRARNARQAGELSGMAQSVGYVLAASGPLFIGLL
ncbi:MAG TPA: MFS transporter, partial [Pseudogracilibacillus sp.]|nr:MFS transporter [Pseudogracilibacillus sp.]